MHRDSDGRFPVCYRSRRYADNTGVLRDAEMKICNKTLTRLRAIARHQKMNSRPA